MRDLAVPRGGVTAVVWLAGGRLLTGDTAGAVHRFDPRAGTRERLFALGPGDYVGTLAASGDGSVVAAGGFGVDLWDAAAGGPWRAPGLSARHLAGSPGPAVSPDGRWLAVGYPDRPANRLAVYDRAAEPGRPRVLLDVDARPVRFTADGRWLVGFRTRTDTLTYWDTATWRVGHRVPAGDGAGCFDAAADGLTVALGSRDDALVYDVAAARVTTVAEVGWRPGMVNPSVRVALLPGGRLAFARGPTVVVWDCGRHAAVAEFPTGGREVLALATAPDGLTLAVGTSNRKAHVIDLDDR